nr:unnamed protein product [Haemonchus contortus]
MRLNSCRLNAELVIVPQFLWLMTLLTTISLCLRKKGHTLSEGQGKSKKDRKLEEQHEDVKGSSGSSQAKSPASLSKSKSATKIKDTLKKALSDKDLEKKLKQTKESHPTAAAAKDKSKQPPGASPESTPNNKPAEAKKPPPPPPQPPPPEPDSNDFMAKAAAAQTIVDPALVQKKGNIDDEIADPVKLKARLKAMDDDMKTVNSLEEEKKEVPKGAAPQQVKWGDAKCVVYEIRDQATLEDDIDDAADLY